MQKHQPVRSNRIPSIQCQPTGNRRLSLTERLYRTVRGFQIRRQLGQLLRALDALEQHMEHDRARAEQLKREFKTSPTLHARRAADGLVHAELSRRRAACAEALAELEQLS